MSKELSNTTSLPFALYDKIKNKNRKAILLAVYRHPVRYNEIMEMTGLKPGSIYHHLKVLEPLVEKVDQGIYQITDQGREVIETLNLVEKPAQKPAVEQQLGKSKESKLVQLQDIQPELDDYVFLGKYLYVLLAIIAFITVALSWFDVAVAGSVLYATPPNLAWIFSLLAFGLGWLGLFIIEDLTKHQQFPHIIRHTLTIRLLSALPSSLVGISLYILFIVGFTLNSTAFFFLFLITLVTGLLVGARSLMYLQGADVWLALEYMLALGIIDLSLGSVILVVS